MAKNPILFLFKCSLLFLLLSTSILYQCKTSSQRSSNDNVLESATAKVETDTQTATSIPGAPGLEDSPFLVTPDGESIVSVDPQDQAAYEAQLAGGTGTNTQASSQTSSGTDTSTTPTVPSDQVIQNVGIVLGAFAGGAVAAGSIVYAKNAMSHPGGALAYFLKPFAVPYFEINSRLNERNAANAAKLKPAYNVVVDFGSTGSITTANKPFTIVSGSPLATKLNGKKLTGQKLYLGILPSDEVLFNPQIKANIQDGLAIDARAWVSSIETVSTVEKFEATRISNLLKVNQVSTPDNDPVSIGNLNAAAEYQEAILVKGKSPYVHCKSGVGRSAEAVAAFLIRNYGMTATEAGNYVYSKRGVVRLGDANATHVHQLAIQDYELYHINDEEQLKARVQAYNVSADRMAKINEARLAANKSKLPILEPVGK